MLSFRSGDPEPPLFFGELLRESRRSLSFDNERSRDRESLVWDFERDLRLKRQDVIDKSNQKPVGC